MTNDDEPRHGATHEKTRDAEPVWRDTSTFSLDLAAVAERFRSAGLDRSLRTLQRYCEQGHLRAAKYPSETGTVWIVDPASVATKIEEIGQIQDVMARHGASSRDVSHSKPVGIDTGNDATTDSDAPRQSLDDADRRVSENHADPAQDPTRPATTTGDTRYVSVPVGLVEVLTHQLDQKDRQIERRDDQIKHLVSANKEDRNLLGTALALIHGNGFRPELERENVPDESVPAFETQPLDLNEDQDRGQMM